MIFIVTTADPMVIHAGVRFAIDFMLIAKNEENTKKHIGKHIMNDAERL